MRLKVQCYYDSSRQLTSSDTNHVYYLVDDSVKNTGRKYSESSNLREDVHILFLALYRNLNSKLEIAAQGVAQCKVSATRVVVDAALRRIGQSRHGGHKNANISGDCERI